MASHTFTVESSLPIRDAYARLVDLERVPEWDDGVTASVRVDDGPDDTPRFDVTVNGFDGQPTSVVYEITESAEPHRFVMVGENDEFRAVDTLELVTTASGSRLTYEGTLELLGDEPPLSPRQLDSMFPKIAAVAESGLRSFLTP